MDQSISISFLTSGVHIPPMKKVRNSMFYCVELPEFSKHLPCSRQLIKVSENFEKNNQAVHPNESNIMQWYFSDPNHRCRGYKIKPVF